MITNTCNSIFWTSYALAPQINDPFIYVPNGLGVLLGSIQFVLLLIFPRRKSRNNINDTNNENKRQHPQQSYENQYDYDDDNNDNEAVSSSSDNNRHLQADDRI